MANISTEKKLELKTELLRYLETADKQRENGVGSSAVKQMYLRNDLQALEYGVEPNMTFWEKWLGSKN